MLHVYTYVCIYIYTYVHVDSIAWGCQDHMIIKCTLRLAHLVIISFRDVCIALPMRVWGS